MRTEVAGRTAVLRAVVAPVPRTAVPELVHEATPPRVPAEPASLTRRASLNAGALLLDYGTRTGVMLLVTPLLVSSLGRAVYGTWEMLGRMSSYMAAADGRANHALRLVIAHEQGLHDDARQRRHVGAAIVVWLLFVPLALACAAAIVWFAPSLTQAPPALAGTVRITAALLAVAMVCGGLILIPEAALHGSNLGYRRMGVQAGMSVVAGLLMAGALQLGLGLEGVGAAQLIVALLTGVLFWTIARTYVPWFGVARPDRAQVQALFGMSAWCAAGDVVARLLLASDVIILGAITSTSTVAVFALTAFAARTTVNFHALMASAAMPGYGDVVGRGEHERAAALRSELLALSWLTITAVGAVLLLWNPSFVTLWVGGASYAGVWPNLLLVLLALQTALIRCDAYVIDAALQPRQRVLISLGAAALAIALMIPLTAAFGMVGLCGGLLVGRLVQSLSYPLVAAARLGTARRTAFSGSLRPAAATALIFACAALLGGMWRAPGWAALVSIGAATVPVAALLAAMSGLHAAQRQLLRRRVHILWSGLS